MLLCIPTSSDQGEEALVDESPNQWRNEVYLAYVEKALPDLHLIVTSAGWDSMDGLDKLRTVAQPTLSALGMETEEYDKLIDRIEEYESNVSPESQATVRMIFGLVGTALIDHFVGLEQTKKWHDIFFDAYSLVWSDTHPEELAAYGECLDRSDQRAVARFKLIFRDWVDKIDNIEKDSSDSEVTRANARAHLYIATKLLDTYGNAPSDAQVCHAEHLGPYEED